GSLAVDRLDGDWLVLRGPVPAGTGRAPHRLWNWRTGTLLDPGEVRAVDLSAGRLARRGDPVRADAPARAAACLTVAPVAGGAAPDRGGVCHPDLRAGDDLLQLAPDARWVAVGAGGGAVVLASADVAAGRWRPLATLPGGSRFARWLDRERFLLHRAATRQEACTVALRCAALALPPGAGDPVAVGVPGAGDL
ncbi:MAG TPA: hypothetical protein VFY17_06140, partial [Pilimelia sp.]|nr:hypothetical protein [Pilimelia sp.]